MQINDELRSIIARVKIDDGWLGRSEPLLHKLSSEMASKCSAVLDIGKSSRECWKLFRRDQIISADINQYEGYPDIIVDVCDASTFPDRKFDGIICHSILEHTYEPFAAVRNLKAAMTEGGIFLGFAPFLMQYHAPRDLKFQDYYRFSRDGLAYMFRDFSEVTLYPIRDQMATAVSLLHPLKRYRNKKGTEYISKALDKFTKRPGLQTTGYVIHALNGPTNSSAASLRTSS
jgi:hypothetical protein